GGGAAGGRFVGRGRSRDRPAAWMGSARLSGTLGNVLDPIASVRRVLALAPGGSADLVSVLALGASEAEARDLALRCAAPAAFESARAAAAKLEGERCARCG